MNKKQIYALSLAAAIGLFGCQSTKNSNPNNPIEPARPSEPSSTAEKGADSSVVISFFSKGAGIDLAAKEKTDELLKDFNLKNQTKLAADSYRWGREGEVDYCLNISTLSAAQQQALKQSLGALLQNKELVRLEYNTVCSRRK